MQSAESENCSISITPMNTGTGEHWQPGMPGALRLGLRHGLLWIGGITAFVLIEKLAPRVTSIIVRGTTYIRCARTTLYFPPAY